MILERKNDLIALAKKYNLEIDFGNNMQMIAEIYWPWNNSGLKIDDKYYRNETLSEDDVINNHKIMQTVISELESNNLQVRKIHYIEYNFVGGIIVEIKNDTLTKVEQIYDFELDHTFKNNIIMEKVDMLAGIKSPLNMFDEPLKKHEREKVQSNILDRISYFNEYGKQQILINLARYSKMIEPMEETLDNKLLDVEFVVEQLFNDDWVYYEDQSIAKKIIRLLSEYKTRAPINLSSGRGYLPDVANGFNATIIKNICVNWTFTDDTAKKVLTFLIHNEEIMSLKVFLEKYVPFEIRDYFGIVEQILLLDMNPKIHKLFFDNWCDINNFYNEFTEDLDTIVVRVDPTILTYLCLKINKSKYPDLFKHLVKAYKNSNLYDISVAKPILKLFLDEPGIDYTAGDVFIITIFNDNKKIKKKILSQPGVQDKLMELGMVEYLPDDVKNIFVF